MSRRDLAQLGVHILDWDFSLAQDPEERRHRHVGDAELLGEPFGAFEQFERNGPTGLNTVDDLLNLRRRNPSRSRP